MPPVTPLLDKVSSPADTRGFSLTELKQLADDVRAETLEPVSVSGGPLGTGPKRLELEALDFERVAKAAQDVRLALHYEDALLGRRLV